jgi:glycosyltransferase involved in cell wall biosynthesis
MRVLQVGESLAVAYGGTAAACAGLTNQLAHCGVTVSLITLGGSNGSGPTWPLDPAVAATMCTPTAPRRLGYCRGMLEILESLAPQNLVHVHGLWRLHYLQSARFARARSIPLIVSVHGMLLGGALRQRAALKRIGRWLFQDAVLRRAHCLHATSPAEAAAIRGLGFRGPIAVVPWGVHPPAGSPSPSQSLVASDTGPRRMVLYLGRLHPTKGLEPLLRAWAQVRERFADWHLVVAGYDEGSYRSTLMALATDLGIAEAVTFASPVQGSAREQLFADASLVVVPSPAENFGFVVPEALVRGVPVIATQGSPWSSLAAEACGWWVPPGAASLAAALVEALSQSPQSLREMGEHGRRLARDRYTWDRVANSMVQLYEWTLRRRDEPAFVQR